VANNAMGLGKRRGGSPGLAGRREADFYPTPEWCVDALLPHLLHRCPPRCGWVLEPGCGDGAIGLPLAQAGYAVRGIDIRPECERLPRRLGDGNYVAAVGDFLEVALGGQWASPLAIVGNPPYSLSMEFIKHSLSLLHGGLLAFLLPLDYLSTQGRAAFWREYPADVLVFDKRPSFTGGGTASTNYGWYMWPPVAHGRGQIFRVGDAPAPLTMMGVQ